MNCQTIFHLIKENSQKIHIASSDTPNETIQHPAGYDIAHHEGPSSSLILKTSSPITIFITNYSQTTIEQGFINNTSTAYASYPTNHYNYNTPHSHDCIEFFYVLSGHFDVHIQNEWRRYSEGMAGIINQNVTHLEHYSADTTAIYLNLMTDYIKNLYDGMHKKTDKPLLNFLLKNQSNNHAIDYIDFIPLCAGTYPELLNSINLLINEMLFKKEGFQTIAKGIIQRIFYYMQLGSMFYCSETSLKLVYSNQTCKKIIDYVQERRYYITRKELANALNYSEDYLNWIFQKETHQNLGAYIRSVYLEEANRLLSSTDMSISQIIERLRLSNRTSFYKQYQKRYGTTPAQYREKNK